MERLGHGAAGGEAVVVCVVRQVMSRLGGLPCRRGGDAAGCLLVVRDGHGTPFGYLRGRAAVNAATMDTEFRGRTGTSGGPVSTREADNGACDRRTMATASDSAAELVKVCVVNAAGTRHTHRGRRRTPTGRRVNRSRWRGPVAVGHIGAGRNALPRPSSGRRGALHDGLNDASGVFAAMDRGAGTELPGGGEGARVVARMLKRSFVHGKGRLRRLWIDVRIEAEAFGGQRGNRRKRLRRRARLPRAAAAPAGAVLRFDAGDELRDDDSASRGVGALRRGLRALGPAHFGQARRSKRVRGGTPLWGRQLRRATVGLRGQLHVIHSQAVGRGRHATWRGLAVFRIARRVQGRGFHDVAQRLPHVLGRYSGRPERRRHRRGFKWRRGSGCGAASGDRLWVRLLLLRRLER
mmetsp:Transcript_20363/g.63265  ORF Transcript_20363/g.63265 Transcript_20363/m.63265 type:complete len:408 (+) Transcript_20363:415-1638(+)